MNPSNNLQDAITKEYLGEYAEKIIFPRVEEIVDERMAFYTNQILTSNDKLAKKLDKIDQEVTFSLANYDRLSKKIEWLEKTVSMLADKTGMRLPSVDAN